MPNRHGNSKSDTVVERTPEMDDPFIQRFKLREGWNIIKQYLAEGKEIHFTIDNIEYIVYLDDYGFIKLQNQETGTLKTFKSETDIMNVCQVIITADKWEAIS